MLVRQHYKTFLLTLNNLYKFDELNYDYAIIADDDFVPFVYDGQGDYVCRDPQLCYENEQGGTTF